MILVVTTFKSYLLHLLVVLLKNETIVYIYLMNHVLMYEREEIISCKSPLRKLAENSPCISKYISRKLAK